MENDNESTVLEDNEELPTYEGADQVEMMLNVLSSIQPLPV